MRIGVEMDIGEPKEYFKILNYHRGLEIGKTKIPLVVFTTMILHDAYITLNGSKVSTFFGVSPPSLEEWTARGPAN